MISYSLAPDCMRRASRFPSVAVEQKIELSKKLVKLGNSQVGKGAQSNEVSITRAVPVKLLRPPVREM
ncbi:MAG TPA: hypothetical protein VF074_19275, partial [Pyrinomonadaceae bacterium]